MANQKKPAEPVKKPFIQGTLTDERTWKSALGVFGMLLLAIFMSFLVSSMMNFDQALLRVLLNCVVEVLILWIFFNNASGAGAEAVARGEILYQRKERGLNVAESEIRLCYHPLKGFFNAFIASIPVLIFAIIMAFTASRQTTSFGVLPSWMSVYTRRSEVGAALTAYTANTGMSFNDFIRLIVRVCIMPFVSMVGAENRDGMLLLERLSPLVVLLPMAAYGIGYMQGQTLRSRVHTEIAQNNRRRARKERKARQKRAARPKGPEQLN